MTVRQTIFAAAFAATIAFAAPALAAGYIKIGDIKGESSASAYRDWIDVLSMSESIVKPSGAATGSVRRRASAQVGDIVVVKPFDMSSPKLREAITQGRIFPKVEIQFTRTPGGAAYYSIELKNAQISSVSGSIADGDAVEEISISFEEVEWTYSTDSGAVQSGWKVDRGVR